MLKKVFALIMASVLLLSVTIISVFAEEGKVEIEFCVGDNTLVINGQSVTVETPYVVGAGVTLVPVRVITEAFGATVGWIPESQTVTLKYPDVDIVLQIGNPVAEVNGKAETLLAAPELPKDTTMVPLRFISETFGADVNYDPETERITVVKDLNGAGSTTVEGAIDCPFVGDSYYGWTMENPVDAIMDYRYFDGTYTSFAYDDINWFDISIKAKPEDFDFDAEFELLKSGFSGYTLVCAERDINNPEKKSMHLQAKNREMFYDVYMYETDKRIYIVFGEFETGNAEMKEKGTKCLATFDTSFTRDVVYDLSNVMEGTRRFNAETLKMTFDVPKNFIMLSDEEAENNFSFACADLHDVSRIRVNVYSKDDVIGAEEYAKEDYEGNMKCVNENVVKFQPVAPKTYNGISGFEYTYDVSASNEKSYNRDFFFEIGEYVYNVYMCVDKSVETPIAFANEFFNSIKAEKIDFEEVGTILRNRKDVEGTTVCDDVTKCEFIVPNEFDFISTSPVGIGVVYENIRTATEITVNCKTDEEYSYSSVKKALRSAEKNFGKFEDVTIVESTKDVTVGENKFAFFELKYVQDDATAYLQQYATVNDGLAYVFTVVYPEKGYSKYARTLVKDILGSLTFK